MSVATALLGPLAGPECKRALARGWLIVIRTLAACVLLGAALVGVWWWWINQSYIDPFFQPFEALRTALAVCEGMLVTTALVMGPAVLAGSLAGEKERGALGLLLTTRVSAREVVLGRLSGKLAQVGMVLLAGVPALVLLAALAGFRLGGQAVLIALPAAVAFGGGGLAVSASALARRGRDALLAVYLGVILFLLGPLGSVTGLPGELAGWLGALNPFVCFLSLIWHEELAAALATIGLWLALGLAGTAVASWRLRPSCLGVMAGARARRDGRRRGRVPPLDERPMLWKELFIDRAGTLGRVGRWLGLLFLLVLGGGSLFFAASVADARWWHLELGREAWALGEMRAWVGDSALFVAWLIEWAIGLRAAVTIASERERGTWDALLTSPLEGGEIVRAKLWGSLFALRGIGATTLLAWTLAYLCGALPSYSYFTTLANTVFLSAFLAAAGVRTSLAAPTATKAMALTIGLWMGAQVVLMIVAGIILGACAFLIVMVVAGLEQLGVPSPARAFPVPTWLVLLSWPLTYNGLILLTTVLVVIDTRLRFDRIAGRMAGERAAIVVDRMLYGGPKRVASSE